MNTTENRLNDSITMLREGKEVFWKNPEYQTFSSCRDDLRLGFDDIIDAHDRLRRFAPLLESLFDETHDNDGIIDSGLVEIPTCAGELTAGSDSHRVYLKCDHALPIAGSIKARGGVYEVLCFAERLALESGLLREDDSYMVLQEEPFREIFSRYTIAVGSTGNLGLSIGIMSRALGFKVCIHMSEDAKQWKKDLLRSKGAEVIEYRDDYSKAVEEGRKQAEQSEFSYFIDDEQSETLFLGYAVAALYLRRQLEEKRITIDAEHPLVVYIPCGVGGAPGGIAFGLKHLFGEHVYCYFVEPIQSPCMLLGLMTGKGSSISVKDIGLTNRTEADGLAVGTPSGLVTEMVGQIVDGIYTVTDEHLYRLQKRLHDTEGIYIEPSAAAGLAGVEHIIDERFNLDHEVSPVSKGQATYIVWTTGGIFVPDEVREEHLLKGDELLQRNSEVSAEKFHM